VTGRHPDKYTAAVVSEWDRVAGCYTVRTEAVESSLDDLILACAQRIAPLGDGLMRLSALVISIDKLRIAEEQKRIACTLRRLTQPPCEPP